MISAPRAPTSIAGNAIFPVGAKGNDEASITRRFVVPKTLKMRNKVHVLDYLEKI